LKTGVTETKPYAVYAQSLKTPCLATIENKGRIHLGISLESFLQEVEGRFVVLPMNCRACARAMGLPAAYPKDPADRIIGATALVEGLSLITADREIHHSKVVDAVW
jgi:PIN domain nuclease of toxin-antitoxin system